MRAAGARSEARQGERSGTTAEAPPRASEGRYARACGLTVSAIKAYENGRRRPSMKAISALYRALGLDAFEIASLYMEVQNDGA